MRGPARRGSRPVLLRRLADLRPDPVAAALPRLERDPRQPMRRAPA
ncbi:hypothetical protein ACI8AV_21035 [Geodermatophilus sp. SYSU D00804]